MKVLTDGKEYVSYTWAIMIFRSGKAKNFFILEKT